MVTWKSKKKCQRLARASIGAKYRAMPHTMCELIWIQNLLQEIGFSLEQPMIM